jgi:hypothetical protein
MPRHSRHATWTAIAVASVSTMSVNATTGGRATSASNPPSGALSIVVDTANAMKSRLSAPATLATVARTAALLSRLALGHAPGKATALMVSVSASLASQEIDARPLLTHAPTNALATASVATANVSATPGIRVSTVEPSLKRPAVRATAPVTEAVSTGSVCATWATRAFHATRSLFFPKTVLKGAPAIAQGVESASTGCANALSDGLGADVTSRTPPAQASARAKAPVGLRTLARACLASPGCDANRPSLSVLTTAMEWENVNLIQRGASLADVAHANATSPSTCQEQPVTLSLSIVQ